MGCAKSTCLLTTLVLILSVVCVLLLALLLLPGHEDQAGVAHQEELVAQTNHVKEAGVGRDGLVDQLLGEEEPWEREVRLPKEVRPLHYELYLHPDLVQDTFYGKVAVQLMSSSPRDHFLVHIKHLEVTSIKLYTGLKGYEDQDDEIDVLEAFEYEPNEFFVVKTNGEVNAGNYTLVLEFKGGLSGDIVGFYRSEYTKPDGSKMAMATSKFQPTYARRAFPCLDEPSFKATFTITLIRPTKDYIALSNMPVAKERDMGDANLTEVTFEKSVPMVTYLVCFIVCDFGYKEKLTEKHHTRFRVYATKQQSHRIAYALDIGANITDYFEDYFDVKYPLPKQDMIAIPDFVSGAMEHWGLITYRETSLLYDDKESSTSNQQRVAAVVSHELAHQWFGNLVTLSWWDDLWLNEGFASYIEYKGVDNYHGEWDMPSQFLTSDLYRVMELDATRNSHPIIQSVNHPDQITEIFDAISYSKGASVLRMLESFMGPESFRMGVSRFLKRFAFDNAVTMDLWHALEEESSLPIAAIMDTWTRQMGFPVLHVQRINQQELKLTQHRFLLDNNKNEINENEEDSSPFGYKWDIPVTWVSSQSPQSPKMQWFNRNESHIDVYLPQNTKWVKFNLRHNGYYRVNYPKESWIQFSQALRRNHDVLEVMDRTSLISDAFALAEASLLDYTVPLSMVEYLDKEEKLVSWKTAAEKLVQMEELLVSTDIYPQFRDFLLSLTTRQTMRLGWQDAGSHQDKLLRPLVLSLACRNGHKTCLEEAAAILQEWIDDENVYIAPNLRALVYKYGMLASGGPEWWSVMLERYVSENNAQEKRKLLLGLANVREPWLLSKLLRLASNETIVRSQDYFLALRYIADNPVGNPLVFDLMRSSWDELVERFSLNNRYLGRLPKYICYEYNTEFQLKQLREFYKAHPDAGAGARARRQAEERVVNNIKWVQRHKKDIQLWLQARTQNA